MAVGEVAEGGVEAEQLPHALAARAAGAVAPGEVADQQLQSPARRRVRRARRRRRRTPHRPDLRAPLRADVAQAVHRLAQLHVDPLLRPLPPPLPPPLHHSITPEKKKSTMNSSSSKKNTKTKIMRFYQSISEIIGQLRACSL